MIIILFLRFNAVSNTPETPAGDVEIRNELVKSLCINREKRQEILVLREKLNNLQKDVSLSNNAELANKLILPSIEPLNSDQVCEKCSSLRCKLDKKTEELNEVIETYNIEIETLRAESIEMKTNMRDMVKNFDKEKLRNNESQNNAMMQLIDDVKIKIESELTTAHQEEITQLQCNIEQLNGELLHTKEEYLRLCEEVKNLEEDLRKELNTEREIKISEIRLQLEGDYTERMSKRENEITDKYIQNLEQEKHKYQQETEADINNKIDHALILAKVEWLEEYRSRRTDEIRVAVQVAEAEWKLAKDSEIRVAVQVAEAEWKLAKDSEIRVAVQVAEAEWKLVKDSGIRVAVQVAEAEWKLAKDSEIATRLDMLTEDWSKQKMVSYIIYIIINI